ncbi:MAG: hypothetical protein ABSH09_16505 [Bryobacteraceae bacterium]|jgi:hypothetical protein
MSKKMNGFFRSLPVTARLPSRFFIALGGPQAHGHFVEEVGRSLTRAAL